MLMLLCFQHEDKSEMLYWREDDIVKSLSTRMSILGEEEGFSQDTLLAKDLELSDSGRYYCVSTGITRTGEEEGAVCYDVIVVPSARGKFVKPVDGINENGQRVAKGWGDDEGTDVPLPGDWRQYGQIIEQIIINDPNQTLELDCTV